LDGVDIDDGEPFNSMMSDIYIISLPIYGTLYQTDQQAHTGAVITEQMLPCKV
jgi:hypothetical protein